MKKILFVLLAISLVSMTNCSEERTGLNAGSTQPVGSPIIRKIKQGAKIIDVRTPQEFNMVHYPGAVNIPVDQIGSRLGEVGSPNSPIIVYCATGNRSSMARRILVSNGYQDVTDAGSIRNMPRNVPAH